MIERRQLRCAAAKSRFAKNYEGQDGKPLRVETLPLPVPVFFEGFRLPASYANFYIANKIVIVPTFNDSNDRVALNTLAGLFPVPSRRHRCRDLVLGLAPALHDAAAAGHPIMDVRLFSSSMLFAGRVCLPDLVGERSESKDLFDGTPFVLTWIACEHVRIQFLLSSGGFMLATNRLRSGLSSLVPNARFVAWLLLGLVAGWLAGKLARGRGYGCITDIILGLIGSYLGGWIFTKLGIFGARLFVLTGGRYTGSGHSRGHRACF